MTDNELQEIQEIINMPVVTSERIHFDENAAKATQGWHNNIPLEIWTPRPVPEKLMNILIDKFYKSLIQSL